MKGVYGTAMNLIAMPHCTIWSLIAVIANKKCNTLI
jgi:hypothetical protein